MPAAKPTSLNHPARLPRRVLVPSCSGWGSACSAPTPPRRPAPPWSRHPKRRATLSSYWTTRTPFGVRSRVSRRWESSATSSRAIWLSGPSRPSRDRSRNPSAQPQGRVVERHGSEWLDFDHVLTEERGRNWERWRRLPSPPLFCGNARPAA